MKEEGKKARFIWTLVSDWDGPSSSIVPSPYDTPPRQIPNNSGFLGT